MEHAIKREVFKPAGGHVQKLQEGQKVDVLKQGLSSPANIQVPQTEVIQQLVVHGEILVELRGILTPVGPPLASTVRRAINAVTLIVCGK
jgi:hypothetical protein